MTKVNLIQASTLRAAVEKIEAALKSGASVPDEFMLKGELLNKLSQLDEVNQQEEHVEEEKKEKSRETAAISYLVEKEGRLNEQEKEKYAHFLSKDCFTKSDLADLSRFYSDGGAYERLSEDGKMQMHQRIEEGINRGHFTRDELPADVKRKDDRIGNEHSANQNLDSGKSASNEADSSKKMNSAETKPDGELVKSSAGEFGNLTATFGEEQASVKPTDLKGTAAGLSRS